MIELRPYQKIGVWRGIHRFKGRVLLADEVGLGKTCQALHIAKHFKGDKPIIVVCPASVKYQWKYEVMKTLGWESWVLSGLKPPATMPLHIPPVIVINWDILRGGWTPRLMSLHPRVVIADEVQFAKNYRSQRTVQFRTLCRNVPHIVMLTGTPIENTPLEFYPSLHLLRPDTFPSFKQFAFRYSIPKMTPWGIKFSGSANERELHHKVTRTCMIRRTKLEVLKELPPLQRTMVPLEIDRQEYEKAEKNFISWLFQQEPEKAFRAKSAIQLTKLTYLIGLAARLKLEAVVQWIQDFLNQTSKKLTIYGHHREILDSIHNHFATQSVLIYGGTSDKHRQLAIDKFVGDKSTRLFIGGITATGSGINRLQTVSSDLIFTELIWNPAKLLQVEGRLHRMGQQNPVNVYYLVARDTVESTLCRAIYRKQKFINAIVDGRSEQLEFSILEEVFNKFKRFQHDKSPGQNS